MLILIFLLSLIIYYPVFSSFFFMDDFYFLQISQAENLRQFINFFKPIKFTPYRPISQQLFFFSFQKIFGLNPLPWHIFIFVFHLLNSFLVYKISLKIIRNQLKARLMSLMYLVSVIHFVGLYSITGSYLVFGLFYTFLSFWFWLRFEEKKRIKFYFLSLLSFILAIFSAEIAAGLPFIILLNVELFSTSKVGEFRRKPERKLRRFFMPIPYFMVVVFNLLINFFFAGAPKTKAFSFKFSSFPSVFRWYILRGFGLPEGVKNGYPWEKNIIYFLFFLLLIILAIGFYKKRKDTSKAKRKTIIKYLLWIIIAALPFYFMPYHLNPIYFSISFIGFLFLLEKLMTKKLFYLYSLISIIISFFSVRLLFHTHWTIRRSNLAKSWISRVKRDCSRFNKEGRVELFLTNQNLLNDLKMTLQESRALQLFCYNDKLETIYKISSE